MRRILLTMVLIAAVVASGWMVLRLVAPSSAIRFDIEGTEGLSIDGEVSTDRETVRLNSVIPTGITARGSHATFRFRKKQADGQMAVTVHVNEIRRGAVTAAGKYRAVQGEVNNSNVTIQAR